MDLSAICAALTATQQADGEARKKAEQQLDEAASGSPNQLVKALCAVLASPPEQVADPLRQEAAVILRQLVVGLATRSSVWEHLEEESKRYLMNQLLRTLEADPGKNVRRSVGQAAAAVAIQVADDFEQLQKEWPDLLAALARFTGAGVEAALRVVALDVLKTLSGTIGEGLFQQGAHAVSMLAGALTEQNPMEVRAAAAQLLLQFVEDLQDTKPLTPVMPAVVIVIQNLVGSNREDELKDTLEGLVAAVEAEPEFFKASNCIKEVSETLLKIAAAGAEVIIDDDVRHSAMEAIMTLIVGLAEDVAQPEGHQLLEAVINLNFVWMLEVEEDVDRWTKEGQDKDEDDCDDDAVNIGEENFDRLGETFAEDVLMPIIFKVIRAATARPDATWKSTRSAIMSLAQVVEHLEEEAWVNQCVDFIVPHLAHAHPRVRYSAFWAIGQVCYDQSPHVQDTYHETLLPAVVIGIDDANIRVATAAVTAFSSMGEDLDADQLEPFVDDLLMRLFNRLHAAESQAMQEQCLSSIAVIAEAAEEQFIPYYSHVMPMLKQVLSKCTGTDQRTLHGKAFECVALIGHVVGKETFLADAHEVMGAMLPLAKEGFAGDDPRRESFHEAAGKIATTLGKDFKPYVEALLPGIFETLKQRPSQKADDDEDDDDDESVDENLRMLGLKTTAIDEMEEALELLDQLIEALDDDFVDFIPAVCQNLTPLLELPLGGTLREKVFGTWGCLAEATRKATACGRIDVSVLWELVTGFLKKCVGAMVNLKADTMDEAACTDLQAQAAGMAEFIRKAGERVLNKEGVKDIAVVIVQLLDRLPCPPDTPAEPGLNRRRGGPVPEEDSDGEEKEPEDDAPVTAQSVRFSLCDVVAALMRSNPEDFAEVALPTFMELVKALVRPERSECDRSLGFYLADGIVDCLGDKTVPYWNWFMNEALMSMLDKAPVIRQFAASTIGHGAQYPVFAPVAPAAASQVHKVLQKHGERHRRRRAVKADAKQLALAVDASIRALGQICEHQEPQLGADAGTAWSMWLSNLPLKYNQDAGQAAHAQLVRLVLRNHQHLTSAQELPRVLSVFADIYKSRFSNDAVDQEIASAVTSLGVQPLQQLCSGFGERQQKKVEQMLKCCAKAGA